MSLNTRTEAKKVFRAIADGKPIHLTDVEMEDKSTLRFDLSLDHSEVPGSLNFRAFRNSVAVLVNNLGEVLKQEDPEITVFSAEDEPDTHLFGVTAVTQEAGQARVMVLGAAGEAGRPVMQLRLMYLDPVQFLESGGGEPA